MNQSQNTSLSYGPDSGSALDNEFWDGFISLALLQNLSETSSGSGHRQDSPQLVPESKKAVGQKSSLSKRRTINKTQIGSAKRFLCKVGFCISL
jgi:hypothetical protein